VIDALSFVLGSVVGAALAGFGVAALASRARRRLEDTFRAVAAEALRGNNESFLAVAEQRLQVARKDAAGDLDSRRAAIDAMLEPMRATLTRLEQRAEWMEKARAAADGRIEQQVQTLARMTSDLGRDATSLAAALKGSQTSGQWGEVVLRNVAELAGMTEHCDFEVQESTQNGRPDMVVRLPGGRRIAVDAKFPRAGYLRSLEATTDDAREAALAEHVAALKGHVRALSSREYAAGLGAGVDLVVLFLPGDPYLAAAFARDPDLQVAALRQRVLVATPTTLVALLRTVAIYHQQESIARNAEEIARVARELYERGAKFGDDLRRVASGLEDAVKAFNAAVGSFDSRFVPMARRLEDLKVVEQASRALESPPLVDVPLRTPKAPPSKATPAGLS
jgi:DNA recombination protein RmuC